MKIPFTALLALLIITAGAQIPTAYYNGTENLTGTNLRLALHNIIDNHTSVSYTSLWTHYQNTDKKSNNYVWDMYSDVPGGTPAYDFTFGSDQCGNYSQEGDCYNREHSWPQSWFSSASPMKTDIFHVVPSDGYTNGQRGNYPYGEVGSATWTSTNGSKKGSCNYPGCTGTVFEPIDEYKGDFARGYFYMSTRYYTEDGSWSSNTMVNKAEILPWAQNMLMEWHVDDPVSAKEISRNNAIYSIQNNRNPFIDHPEFAQLIFASNYPQPIVSSTPLSTGTENTLYEYTIVASDSYGNTINFAATGLPSWLTLNDNGNNTATLSGTPALADVGINTISIMVSNQYGLPLDHAFTIDISAVTSVLTISGFNGFSIYPNPASEFLVIQSTEIYQHVGIKIYNTLGRLLLIKQLEELNTTTELNINELSSGIYYLKLEGESINITSRLLVQ
jgi:endonuclease I